MTQPELFPVASYGTPRPSLSRARELVERIVVYLSLDSDGWDEFDDGLARLAEDARAMGAHSVARALRWLSMPGMIDLADPTAGFDRTARIAHRWLARMERSARP